MCVCGVCAHVEGVDGVCGGGGVCVCVCVWEWVVCVEWRGL